MNTNPWKKTYPDAIGLYIASTTRGAGAVRCFTGKHWTAPTMVMDMHMPDRVPQPDWPEAETCSSKAIEWLEPYVADADGFVKWSGLHPSAPVRPDVKVLVKLRGGAISNGKGDRAGSLRWGHIDDEGDIVAYRVCTDAVVTAPANDDQVERRAEPRDAPAEKISNPKDMVGVRKAPMSTVSAAVLAEVGVAMLEGASKYGRHNYRAVGVRSSVYYDGTLRHLFAWWEGQDIDPDSGMSHITKAITSLVVLRDAMIQGKCEDDRAPRSTEFYEALNVLASQIVDRYADKNPRHYTIGDSEAAA